MKKRKHIRKLISLLLVIALMSTCLGIGSVSVLAEDPPGAIRRGCCIGGADDAGPTAFTNCINAMNQAFKNMGVWTPDNPDSPNYIDPNGSNYDPNRPYPYLYTENHDKVADVIAKIQLAFAGSTEDDINYLYVVGHGSENANCMNLGGTFYYGGNHYISGVLQPTLKSTLDAIPGHFIIFINSCYSGQAITPNTRSEEQNDQDDAAADDVSSQEILESFLGTTRNGELAGTTKYTVFCSSEANMASHGGSAYPIATYVWARGLGWLMNSNGVGGHVCPFWADATVWWNGYPSPANGDEIVTAKELGMFAAYEVHTHYNWAETPCYYSMYPFRTIAPFYDSTQQLYYSLGDVNKDEYISGGDIAFIYRIANGIVTPTSLEQKLADINGDGDITTTDAIYLSRYFHGIPLP